MSKHVEQLTPVAKAHQINLDIERYGTFAEIGAGQEVARHFFQAGKASQTIAKTISAYDMVFSDEIYGREKNGRYVCESRLGKMLEKEYNLLLKRLTPTRGSKTKFFAFASTVATGTSDTPRCYGWMGVRFQSHVEGEFNDIILHHFIFNKIISPQYYLLLLYLSLSHSLSIVHRLILSFYLLILFYRTHSCCMKIKFL